MDNNNNVLKVTAVAAVVVTGSLLSFSAGLYVAYSVLQRKMEKEQEIMNRRYEQMITAAVTNNPASPLSRVASVLREESSMYSATSKAPTKSSGMAPSYQRDDVSSQSGESIPILEVEREASPLAEAVPAHTSPQNLGVHTITGMKRTPTDPKLKKPIRSRSQSEIRQPPHEHYNYAQPPAPRDAPYTQQQQLQYQQHHEETTSTQCVLDPRTGQYVPVVQQSSSRPATLHHRNSFNGNKSPMMMAQEPPPTPPFTSLDAYGEKMTSDSFSATNNSTGHNYFTNSIPRTPVHGGSWAQHSEYESDVTTFATEEFGSKQEAFLERRKKLLQAKIDLLKCDPIFSKISPSTLNTLASKMKYDKFDKGDTIVTQGHYGDCMFFIGGGQVATYNVQNEMLSTLSENDYFGEYCVFRGGVRATTTRALTEVHVFSLSREPLMEAVAICPPLKEGMERSLIKRNILGEYSHEKRKDLSVQREIEERTKKEVKQYEDSLARAKNGNLQKNFSIVRQIGEGSFGAVFYALDDDGHPLAVKRMHTRDMTKGMIAELEQEAAMMELLRHPNVVEGHGIHYDKKKDEMYLLMEYLPMGSLCNIVAESGPLLESVARTYIKQLLEGIQYLHSKGILHRDIKPGNALISAKGIVKVADFGICRKGLQVKTVTLNGTPPYMSPESLEGTYSIASDIWAIGCTLLELIQGYPPWAEKGFTSPAQMMFAISTSDGPALPPVVTPGQDTTGCISAPLHDLFTIMFAKDPAARLACEQLLKHKWFTVDASELPSTKLILPEWAKMTNESVQSYLMRDAGAEDVASEWGTLKQMTEDDMKESSFKATDSLASGYKVDIQTRNRERKSEA